MRDPKYMRVIKTAFRNTQLTYALTRRMPADERYVLIPQMRRAATSVGSNIAEGCGRATDRQLLHCLSDSMGSLRELEHQAQTVQLLELAGDAYVVPLLETIQSQVNMMTSLATEIRRKLDSRESLCGKCRCSHKADRRSPVPPHKGAPQRAVPKFTVGSSVPQFP